MNWDMLTLLFLVWVHVGAWHIWNFIARVLSRVNRLSVRGSDGHGTESSAPIWFKSFHRPILSPLCSLLRLVTLSLISNLIALKLVRLLEVGNHTVGVRPPWFETLILLPPRFLCHLLVIWNRQCAVPQRYLRHRPEARNFLVLSSRTHYRGPGMIGLWEPWHVD